MAIRQPAGAHEPDQTDRWMVGIHLAGVLLHVTRGGRTSWIRRFSMGGLDVRVPEYRVGRSFSGRRHSSRIVDPEPPQRTEFLASLLRPL